MGSPEITRVPFRLDVERVIEVLSGQIYQSPLALLRENVQNSFDAILMRRRLTAEFEPRISIRIDLTEIEVSDNGVGMTQEELTNHYWKGGSSSKNTDEARAAGVVGTFGIGAMANFGIADRLTVVTESAATGERTRSSVQRADLQNPDTAVTLESLVTQSNPGTTVTATLPDSSNVNVNEAVAYITEFVQYVDVPVFINDEMVSGRDIAAAVQPAGDVRATTADHALTTDLHADLELRITGAGDVWISARNIRYADREMRGEVYLRQNLNNLRTFRSGFGLASTGVASSYGFGGVANLAELHPTAGREALTTESTQLLQLLVTGIDTYVSNALSEQPECDNNTNFMNWVRQHGRYDLCGLVKIRNEPGNGERPLAEYRQISGTMPLNAYDGNDIEIIRSMSSDDAPLLVLASNQPRRGCQEQYLRTYCTVDFVENTPTVTSYLEKADWTYSQQALVFRVASTLESDYFLPAAVRLGTISHGLPVLATSVGSKVEITFNPASASFAAVAQLYEAEFSVFGSMVKDFVRNTVFPLVRQYVPSSTREGADAFLRSIKRVRDFIEYDVDDLGEVDSIWELYKSGELSFPDAVSRFSAVAAAQPSVQIVDSASTGSVRDLVGESATVEIPVDADQDLFEALPPILRLENESEFMLLTIPPGESALGGYRHFIALSERAKEEKGHFFLQPHTTSVIWGGQKVVFVFEHHSRTFGLYYDLQTTRTVSASSGGGQFPTSTIVTKSKTYIPIPAEIAAAFVPEAGDRKRFEVRCDVIYTDEGLA